MSSIGILLAFPPHTNLSSEGTSRLLSMLIKGSLAQEGANPNTAASAFPKTIIAAPRWSRPDIEKLLEDNTIPLDCVETIYTTNTPLFMHILNIISHFRQGGGGRFKRVLLALKNHISDLAYSALVALLSSHSVFLKTFLFLGFLFFISAAAVTAAFLVTHTMILLVTAVALAIAGTVMCFSCRKTFFNKIKDLPSIKRFRKKRLNNTKNMRRLPFLYDLFLQIRLVEVNRLIHQLNQRKDIKAWYIPTGFWPEVAALEAPKIIAVPDVVFLDYPSFFSGYSFGRVHELIRQTMNIPANFLCYSEEVKQRHFVQGFGIAPERVKVIHHGRSEMQKNLQGKDFSPSTPMRQHAAMVIRDYQKSKLFNNLHLNRFDFSSMQFFTYSSQYRPYKNMLQLVKAYHALLRKKRINVKLLLTANLGKPEDGNEVAEYIAKHALQYDVLTFHNLPSKVLAAFNHLAIAAVNPSLFEGGFPFTFAEAYSVGTPSLMSATPHVQEIVTDPELAKLMLFDPYDVKDIAAKMAWVAENRDALFAAQKPLYDSLPNWDAVATQYHEYFSKVANGG